jgi:hypothetical protein
MYHCSCLFQRACCEGFPHRPSSALRAPCPLCYVSFLLLLLIFQFFFYFSLGGASVCQGGYADLAQGCLWEYHVPLNSLVVCILPSHRGAAVWRQHGSPCGFSVEREVEMLCTGWRCGGVKVLPLLGGFYHKVYLQRLSKILL